MARSILNIKYARSANFDFFREKQNKKQNVIDSSTVNEFKNKLDKEWMHIRFNVDEVY